jgi:hypothetical protein
MKVKVLKAPDKEDFDKIVQILLNGIPEDKEGMSCLDCDDPTCENYCENKNANYYDPPQAVTAAKEPARRVIGSDIFEMAKRIVNGHRQDDYGSPEDSFQNIANYWNAYFAQIHDKREDGLTAEDVAIMMVLFKIARLGHGYTRDSVVDMCGYSAIYANMHGD